MTSVIALTIVTVRPGGAERTRRLSDHRPSGLARHACFDEGRKPAWGFLF
jgi:hypothetical protein